ncbi:MAG: hypothetical protein ACI915_001990 [Gammaproteobacteria bacterium]|jgi:hypothetical protein
MDNLIEERESIERACANLIREHGTRHRRSNAVCFGCTGSAPFVGAPKKQALHSDRMTLRQTRVMHAIFLRPKRELLVYLLDDVDRAEVAERKDLVEPMLTEARLQQAARPQNTARMDGPIARPAAPSDRHTDHMLSEISLPPHRGPANLDLWHRSCTLTGHDPDSDRPSFASRSCHDYPHHNRRQGCR